MTDKALECPVFRPTLDEVRSLTFVEYVEKVEPQWLHAGICRIVAPEGWTPRRSGYDDLDHLTLPRPIRQHATGRQGLYRTLLVEQRSLPLASFKEMASDPTNDAPAGEADTLERKFWKNVPMNPPLYGADVPGSLFDERLRGWNLKRLNSLLSTTLESSGAAIPGVTQPYLYAGSWRSFFAWHTEDLDLHSVNYLHTGKPKTWYVVPPAARERFELLARDLLPELSRCCPEFLRHKEILMSPALLAAHNIPLVKAVHNAREFVVVGPGAYHAGFNHGFNIAESVNFATKAWVPVGARASFCTCRPDSVKIDMRLFLDYMDTDLAQEVKESYRSDSEDESDEEESEEEEESDAEGSEEEAEAGAGDETSSSEEESSSDEESEEEELPAKRLRRPSAKAAASGLVYSYSPPPAVPPAASAKQARPAALQRLNKDQRGIGRRQGKGVSPPARRQSPVLKEQKALAAARKARQGKAAAAAAARRRPAVPVSRKRSVLRGDGNRKVVSAAAAAAAVHASSDDESQDGAIRAGSKRGAAQAWYRLFDSLLPALKRARA